MYSYLQMRRKDASKNIKYNTENRKAKEGEITDKVASITFDSTYTSTVNCMLHLSLLPSFNINLLLYLQTKRSLCLVLSQLLCD